MAALWGSIEGRPPPERAQASRAAFRRASEGGGLVLVKRERGETRARRLVRDLGEVDEPRASGRRRTILVQRGRAVRRVGAPLSSPQTGFAEGKGTSRIEITATPGADVRVDGVTVGRAPFPDAVDVSPGHHTVSASLDANNKSAECDAPAGGVTKIAVAFPGYKPVGPTPAPRYWTTSRFVGIGMLGAGLIAAGFATGFAVASSKDASSAETLRASHPDNFCNGVTSTDCSTLDDLVSSRVREANLAMGMGIAGGALVVAGAVLLVLPTPKPKEASVWLVPGFGGASLVGRF